MTTINDNYYSKVTDFHRLCDERYWERCELLEEMFYSYYDMEERQDLFEKYLLKDHSAQLGQIVHSELCLDYLDVDQALEMAGYELTRMIDCVDDIGDELTRETVRNVLGHITDKLT